MTRNKSMEISLRNETNDYKIGLNMKKNAKIL